MVGWFLVLCDVDSMQPFLMRENVLRFLQACRDVVQISDVEVWFYLLGGRSVFVFKITRTSEKKKKKHILFEFLVLFFEMVSHCST